MSLDGAPVPLPSSRFTTSFERFIGDAFPRQKVFGKTPMRISLLEKMRVNPGLIVWTRVHPALNQNPHTRLIALVASVIQTVSLRSLRRMRIDLGQTVLLAGATIAAILCLTQAAELRSNSNRAGFMALSLLTPTFLFASKNSPAALLLGKGYEKLNWVHRWAGRLLFLMATVHGSLWINNRIRNGKEELLHTGIKETRGMAAYGTLCMIVLLSLRPVRSYAYQFFYLSHTLGYITFFIVICYHTPYAQPWIFPPIAFWGLDLVLRLSRFRFKDAYLTPVDQQMTLVRIPDVQGGWIAGQHVRLRVFFGGRPFESHPLTILNADSATTALPQSSPTSTGITLGVRAVGDWSTTYIVWLGSILQGKTLDLGDFESVLLVAGGSGATFTLGVLDDIVGRIVRHGRAKGEKTRLIKYVWFIKSYGCISWFAPIFAHLAEACHGTSLSLSFQFYVTCLCDPSNLIAIRNSTVEEFKPMIEELLAPLLQHNADPEKTTPSSVTGGVAVAASGPETLLQWLKILTLSLLPLVDLLPTSRPDLPSINLSLDQIEAQSRRLVSKQPVAPSTSGKATYLLAGGNVDANAHADLVANLNTVATFAPLTQLHDADVSGYLRHSHEQTIISCIEEGRRETEQEFYRVLDERVRRDWEVRKKKIFDELGKFNVGDNTRGGSSLRASALGRTVRGATTGVVSQPATSLSMFNKMMAYDKIIRGLNQARLAGTAYPVVSALIQTAQTYAESAPSIAPTLELLRHMVAEPPSLTLPSCPAAAELRTNIANGARVGLEKQYLEFVDATIQRDPANAAIGGDPSVSNRIMGYLRCAFYRGGRWDEDLELLRGRPVWAHIFYLVRTGHLREALDVANESADALERSEQYFLSYLKAWVESSDRRLPKILRDRLQTTYNSHILHSPNADPFKVALFKLIGRLDPSRRAVRRATNTAEDWIWFQLAMVDEDEGNGLPAKRGMWARVLMVCGLFEQAIAALYENPDHRIEAVHIAVALAYYGLLRVPSTSESSQVDILTAIPFQPSALNLALLITRYVKPFMTSDPKEAIQYAYCVSLSHDQGQNVGKEQVDYARELTRRIIVAAPAGWDDLVGGLRPDGTRYSGVVEHDMQLLHIKSPEEYRDVIVLPAAQLCEQDQKPIAAIRLYNLAGKTNIVLGCLSRALGDSLSDVNSSGEEAKQLEASAREILTHYERRGETLDQNQAISLSATGDLEGALAALDNPDLLPLDAETSTIARRAEEFRDQDDPLTHNIGQLLLLAMSILHQIHTQAKSAQYGDIGKQSTLNIVKKKTRALISFAGMLKYRLSADIFGQLTRMSVTVLH
ncbi:nucleoporin-interacting protein NIC96 [Ceratobasidium sp. AG-Ba]|nr:nucleoporin-interacting protein NIC96 [Ceratobasidium sp. AG-Ba]